MDDAQGNPISSDILHRKGARKISDVPNEVVERLQKGQLQSINLTEWLAVNHIVLLQNVLNDLGLERVSPEIIQRLNDLRDKTKVMKIIPAIAREWHTLLDSVTKTEQSHIFNSLSEHRSDSVRCWAAYIVGEDESLSTIEKLEHIRPFAADSHFGVREISWMAVREPFSRDLHKVIELLGDWVRDEDANIRRFAIELTRPQGVWAKHITALKENPAIALPLLEVVKSDSTKYVQDSVSNWLNDASKSNPEWVIRTCDIWLSESDTKETKRIVTRAKRSLVKT